MEMCKCGLFYKLLRFIRDINTVRLGANREISHVVRFRQHWHFQMSRDLQEFGVAYSRLPSWARNLAVSISSAELSSKDSMRKGG